MAGATRLELATFGVTGDVVTNSTTPPQLLFNEYRDLEDASQEFLRIMRTVIIIPKVKSRAANIFPRLAGSSFIPKLTAKRLEMRYQHSRQVLAGRKSSRGKKAGVPGRLLWGCDKYCCDESDKGTGRHS